VVDRPLPDSDSFFDRTCLPDARHNNRSKRGRICAQELRVVREKDHVIILDACAKLGVGHTAPVQRDHVIGLHAVRAQRSEETEREVLVEEDFHDAWRTAGGKCAAT
jgi:hypothetical protein